MPEQTVKTRQLNMIHLEQTSNKTSIWHWNSIIAKKKKRGGGKQQYAPFKLIRHLRNVQQLPLNYLKLSDYPKTVFIMEKDKHTAKQSRVKGLVQEPSCSSVSLDCDLKSTIGSCTVIPFTCRSTVEQNSIQNSMTLSDSTVVKDHQITCSLKTLAQNL